MIFKWTSLISADTHTHVEAKHTRAARRSLRADAVV